MKLKTTVQLLGMVKKLEFSNPVTGPKIKSYLYNANVVYDSYSAIEYTQQNLNSCFKKKRLVSSKYLLETSKCVLLSTLRIFFWTRILGKNNTLTKNIILKISKNILLRIFCFKKKITWFKQKLLKTSKNVLINILRIIFLARIIF